MAEGSDSSEIERQLEKIRLNYVKLVEQAKAENMKCSIELEKRVMDEEEELKIRQEEERRDFEMKILKEKYAMRERHLKEKSMEDKKAEKRLRRATEFISNINPESEKDALKEQIG